MLWTSLLLFLLMPGYDGAQIEKERATRNELFRDPLRSPLATVGIRLLDRPEIIFGSSPNADLVWNHPSIQANHVRIVQNDGAVFIEPLEGEVQSVPQGQAVGRSAWTVNQLFSVGPVLLVLQIHPVGPVVRIVDPSAEAFREFTALPYFDVDPRYRVEGEIRPRNLRQVKIVDTQGWSRTGWTYGRIEFILEGSSESLDLILFEEHPGEDSQFMLIFQDQTSGDESYPACRYLYLPFRAAGKTWIDFNQALNPSCAYGDGFACPLPPPGNRLKVAVRAGEKNFPRAH